MTLKVDIKRCCDCGFNEHDQEPYESTFNSYLGYNFWEHRMGCGGRPRIVCLYNPKESFRSNIRRITHGRYWDFVKVVAIAGEPEFHEQMEDIPVWCPLRGE